MRLLITLFILTSFVKVSLSQPIETNHPDTLKSPSTTFYVRFPFSDEKNPLLIGRSDTVDLGTDGAPGRYATIYYGNDSLRIDNTNFPYFQVHYIPIRSRERLITYRLHFNPPPASFPQPYINRYTGKVQFEVPEVYELANILLLLSPAGMRAKNMDKESAYSKQVMSHFKPFLNHPVFKSLNFPDSSYFRNYYDFRENSFCFSFENDRIVRPGPYYFVIGGDEAAYMSLFKKLIPEIEDFARVSRYREFYKRNTALYQQLLAREEQLIPVKNMWNWIEKEFPKISFKAYKIVFSPVILASHSAQKFYSMDKYRDWFSESVMFICGPDSFDRNKKWTEKQKEGLLSGIVFTEIDHNYVNPTSDEHGDTIDSIFTDRAKWTIKRGDNDFYPSPISVFNEYMTHALFSLYVLDVYDAETSEFLIKQREALMVENRGFSRFRDFNQALIRLRNENKTRTTPELYPLILDWCKKDSW